MAHPSVRRKFIDWGVFHVEHGFYETWKSFNRILKQRNTLLRSGQDSYSLYEPWDLELIKLSRTIEKHRLNYLSRFQLEMNKAVSILDDNLLSKKIYYKNGWGVDRIEFNDLEESKDAMIPETDLLNLLIKQFQKDCKYQRTHIGPHRADIQLR